MSVLKAPAKAVISVSEMAEVCRLSRSRFYALMESGVFPRPVLNGSGKRPVFDQELQMKCLEIRRTGMSPAGSVTFNRRRKETSPRRDKRQARNDHSDLLKSLASLGVTVTAEAVGTAVKELFPGGTENLDHGEIIRQTFLHLRTMEASADK